MSFLRAVLFILASSISISSYSQKILVFDRDGHDKRIRFRIHDEIAVRTIDGSSWTTGEITDMSDSAITIGGNVVVVSRIEAIRYDSRSSGVQLLRNVTYMLPFAGLALISIYAINAIINNDYPAYSDNTLIISGAFIVSRPIVYLLIYHKHKINQHHRLKIIDVSIR